jgi:hypothetical protein
MKNTKKTTGRVHQTTSPLFPDELARRDDIAATTELPDKIAHQFATPNLIISSMNAKLNVAAQITRSDEGGWYCVRRA